MLHLINRESTPNMGRILSSEHVLKKNIILYSDKRIDSN